MYKIGSMPSSIPIGYTGETNFRIIEIDMSAWMDKMPDGVPSIVHIRPGEEKEDAYVAVTEFDRDTGILSWTITAADIGTLEGEGEMQVWLEETENDTVNKRGKSVKVKTKAIEAANDPDETVPSSQEAFLEQVTSLKTQTVTAKEAAEDAQAAAEDAQEAAEQAAEDAENVNLHPAYIDGTTKHWMVYDADNSQYVDTQIKAEGEDGQDGQDATPTLVCQAYADLTFPVTKDTLCYKDGTLYKAKQDISTSEAWTAAHWDATNLATEQRLLLSAIQGISVFVTPQMYGAKADGITDDSDAIISALSHGDFVFFPEGIYGITKTIFVDSNKTLMGCGDSSIIKLIDDGSHLTSHVWYPNQQDYPYYYPYITTEEDSHNIKVIGLRVEGNTATSSVNLHVGIAIESSENVAIKECNVWKINYHLENAPERPSGQWRTGWNIAALRSKNVEVDSCVIQYGAYECLRIGPYTEDVYVHDCIIEYGWRTAFQIVRGCTNVILEKAKITQDDFEAYDTTACITLHPSSDDPINNVLIKDCYIQGTLYKNQDNSNIINTVDAYCFNVVVDGCTIIGKGGTEIGIIAYRELTVRDTYIDVTESDDESAIGISHMATTEANKNNSHLIVENTKIIARNLAINVFGGLQQSVIIRECDLKTAISHGIYYCASSAEDVQIKDNKINVPGGKDGIIIISTAGMNGGIISGNIFKRGRYAIGGGSSGGVVNTLIVNNVMKDTTSNINANITNVASNVIANNITA